MSTKTLKEKVIYEGKIEKLILKPFYDHHGDIIWMHEDNVEMKNKNIKIKEVRRYSRVLERQIKELQLYIEDERYTGMEITGVHGSTKILEITGCAGAG